MKFRLPSFFLILSLVAMTAFAPLSADAKRYHNPGCNRSCNQAFQSDKRACRAYRGRQHRDCMRDAENRHRACERNCHVR